MKPTYAALKMNYRSPGEFDGSDLDKQRLCEELGCTVADLLAHGLADANTSAARASLALVKSGVRFHGRLPIKGGPYSGRSIELRAKRLAEQLSLPHAFGKPEVVLPPEAKEKLNGRKGVVFFHKGVGHGGGHIGLIQASNTASVWRSKSFFTCKEVWFWSLV